MHKNLRFFIIILLLIVIPYCLTGSENQKINNKERIVLSDSLVKVQLKIADSYKLVNALAADSVLNELLEFQIQDKTLKEKVIELKCSVMLNLSHSTESIDFLETIINNGDSNPQYYFFLAKSYMSILKYSKAISSAQEAIFIYNENNDWKGVVDIDNYLGEIYSQLEMFEEAGKYFNESVEISNRINYKNGLLTAYKVYGNNLVFKNPTIGLELLLKAKKIAEANEDKGFQSIAIYLIRFYINTNQNSKAKAYVNEYFREYGLADHIQASNIYTLMAHIYSLEKNVDSTIFYNIKALSLRTQIDNKPLIASSYLNLAGNYIAKGDIETANIYLDKAENTVFESNNQERILTYYRGKVKYFEFIKDFKNAYLFSEKEIKLSRELDDI
ncbi:MAG: tetratricopeptide repeat protein, partial [Bacteroidales bacterium]|nr:tetratricopeptide repeat protein [Bacteroidales bacterium]